MALPVPVGSGSTQLQDILRVPTCPGQEVVLALQSLSAPPSDAGRNQKQIEPFTNTSGTLLRNPSKEAGRLLELYFISCFLIKKILCTKFYENHM
jgi:hypothetical protein